MKTTNISYKVHLVAVSSFRFRLSEKSFLSPSVLHGDLAECDIPGCTVLSFSTLSIFCHALLACWSSADSLMSSPWYVTYFLRAAFQIAHPWLLPPWLQFVLVWASLSASPLALPVSWTWISVFFPQIRKLFGITSSNILSAPFTLSSPESLSWGHRSARRPPAVS